MWLQNGAHASQTSRAVRDAGVADQVIDAKFTSRLVGNGFDVCEAEHGDDRVQRIERVGVREKRGGGAIGEHSDSM